MPESDDPIRPPVAFVSHASEDKPDFAEPLARMIANLGVQPWLDKWEIRPGDSLVQMLFDEGLATADAVILVVSQYSVSKPWVREELDHATVQRVNRGTRLIPVRLDNVPMPAPLQHLLWVDAERSAASVQATARKIADTLHGHDARPSVGPPPTYTMVAPRIPGLTPADAFVLTEIIREAIASGHLLLLDWNIIESRAQAAGVTAEALVESMHALGEGDYVDVSFRAEHVHDVKLTRFGYSVGISAVLPDVDQVHQRVVSALVNDPPTGIQIIHNLADRASTERLVVDQLLKDLEDRGLVTVSRGMGDSSRLHNVSPTLRRVLDEY
uniref:toll/interleukin-1 receptor domain-containing protein n=1 Tax=Herbidospora sakaeratensis TaxID=564415 RepID=UPI0007822EFF|nr:toll/interleukin-1 receptor domain-containing protein [Herbidospora sakaeratensis]